MSNDDRLTLRVPSDLKALFTTLCEKENISVSAKIKELMAVEVQKTLDKSMFHQNQLKILPRKPKTQANETVINPLVASAINSAKHRKKKRKKNK